MKIVIILGQSLVIVFQNKGTTLKLWSIKLYFELVNQNDLEGYLKLADQVKYKLVKLTKLNL